MVTASRTQVTADARWADYLRTFHGQRAGITEDVLVHALDDTGRTPYDWLADGVPAAATVLDLACGNGSVRSSLPGRRWTGLDLSVEELALARSRGLPVARADAVQLPLRDRSVDVVVVSMALMLLPLAATLAEVSRVLRPGGLLVATVPVSGPLGHRDRWRYTRLCLALRHRGLAYPQDLALRDAAAACAAGGLDLRQDETRSFVCQVRDSGVADQLLASLYLPDVPTERLRRGTSVVRSWVGTGITTPVRRLVAVRASG